MLENPALTDLVRNVFSICGEFLPKLACQSSASNDPLRQDAEVLRGAVDPAGQTAVAKALAGNDLVTKTNYLTFVREEKVLDSTTGVRNYIRANRNAPGAVVTRQ
jgi:hypothetical protein